MNIRVNGKDIDFHGQILMDLFEFYKIDSGKVVVEKNRMIVHRDNYGSETLADGDIVEIVSFVGGG